MPNDPNIKTVLINITYASRSLNWFTNFDIGSDPETVHQLCEEFFSSVDGFMEFNFNPKQGYPYWSITGFLNENKTRTAAGEVKSINR